MHPNRLTNRVRGLFASRQRMRCRRRQRVSCQRTFSHRPGKCQPPSAWRRAPTSVMRMMMMLLLGRQRNWQRRVLPSWTQQRMVILLLSIGPHSGRTHPPTHDKRPRTRTPQRPHPHPHAATPAPAPACRNARTRTQLPPSAPSVRAGRAGSHGAGLGERARTRARSRLRPAVPEEVRPFRKHVADRRGMRTVHVRTEAAGRWRERDGAVGRRRGL
jgi:hypothetical protein